MRVVISVSGECNLCGLCAECCPTGVFRVAGSRLEVRQDACVYCKGCEVLCPVGAIRVRALDEGLKITRVRTLLPAK